MLHNCYLVLNVPLFYIVLVVAAPVAVTIVVISVFNARYFNTALLDAVFL